MSRRALIEDDSSQYVKIIARLLRLERSLPRLVLGVPARGQSLITWPGGSSVSDLMTFAHGLNGSVQAVASANEPLLNVAVITTDATNITIQARDIAGTIRGAGSFGIVRWIAVL